MSTALSALARPEYTGENRCWPCTTLNLAVLAVVSLGLSLVLPLLSLVVAVGGLAGVRYRGYLIPYTPAFAPRLVSWLPWNPFHADRSVPMTDGDGRAPRRGTRRPRDPETPPSHLGDAAGSDAPGGHDRSAESHADGEPEPDGTAASGPDGEAILAVLTRAGVLDVSSDDVALDSDFEDRWRAEMRSLAGLSADELASATHGVSPASAAARAVSERDRTYVVLSDGSDDPAGETWIRRPVAVAETAAARALADRDVDADRRPAAAHGLGVFLETCPVCDAALAERPAGGCCGPPRTDADGSPLQALVCDECRAEFAVFD